MKLSYNTYNTFKYFLIIILIILCVDLVFNFSGILVENFDDTMSQISNSYNSANTEGGCKPYPNNLKPVQSIISKNTGKVINVKPLGEAPTKKFLVHFYGDNAITLNDDGTYSLGLSNSDNIKQQFDLVYIPNASTYLNHIPKEYRSLDDSGQVLGYDVNKVTYPFYMGISAYDKKKCLQYDSGSVMVRPIGNYDSQKWDISYEAVKKDDVIQTHRLDPMSQLTSDFRLNPNSTGSNEYAENSDKIKINLNLSSNNLAKILGNSINGNADGNADNNTHNINEMLNNISNESSNIDINSQNCPDCKNDDWIPRNNVKSICSNCDPDLIDPIE